MASLHSVTTPPAAAPPGAAGKDAAQAGPVPGSLTEDVPECYTSHTHVHQLFPAAGIVAELPHAEPATELFGAFAGPGLALATSVAETPGILKAKVSKQLALSVPGGPEVDLQAQVAALSAQLAESRAEAAALRCSLLADFGGHAPHNARQVQCQAHLQMDGRSKAKRARGEAAEAAEALEAPSHAVHAARILELSARVCFSPNAVADHQECLYSFRGPKVISVPAWSEAISCDIVLC